MTVVAVSLPLAVKLIRADSLHSMKPFSAQGGHFGLSDMVCILGKIEPCFEKPSASLTAGFTWLGTFCKMLMELLLLKLGGGEGKKKSCIAAQMVLGKKR